MKFKIPSGNNSLQLLIEPFLNKAVNRTSDILQMPCYDIFEYFCPKLLRYVSVDKYIHRRKSLMVEGNNRVSCEKRK